MLYMAAMDKRRGGERMPKAFTPLVLLLFSIVPSEAFVALFSVGARSQLEQHLNGRGAGGRCRGSVKGRDQERHRKRALRNQPWASAAASPPGGYRRDQQQRQRPAAATPLGMLDASVAVPAVPGDKEDGSSDVTIDSGTTRSIGAPHGAAAHKQERGISSPGSGEGTGGDARRKDRRRPESIGDLFRRTASGVLSYLTIMTTWILFRFLLKGLNKVECDNRQGLLDAVLDRGDRGLLTVSNHMCVYDDPGLWSAILPFWRTGRKKMRWALCTDDIYNANPVLRNILEAGRTLPIRRTRGMEQPLFKVFFDKLERGEWGHIFAEGAIRQPWRFGKGEPILGDFKAGIGRLLLRSKDPPLVLPMYHIGMHQIVSETPIHKRGRGKLTSILPKVGRKVRVYVGEPIDVSPIVNKCREPTWARMSDRLFYPSRWSFNGNTPASYHVFCEGPIKYGQPSFSCVVFTRRPTSFVPTHSTAGYFSNSTVCR
ncbi:unnamed protein product [Scytosiphon promiscuus]